MFSRFRQAVLALLFLLPLAGCGSPAENRSETEAPARKESFTLTLKPVLDSSGEVAAIAVSSVIDASLIDEAAPFSLSAPIVYANVHGVADRVGFLEVSDRNGAVPLTIVDDAPVSGGFPYYRRWRAARDVVFPVTVSYSSAVQPPDSPGGPAFGIRPAAGGVSGAGSGFLVIPENVSSIASHVTWDLSAFGERASAISTFGEGAFVLEGPPAALTQGWYMAGPLERFPERGDHNGFSAAWLGDFPFDEQSEMAYAGDVYDYLGAFFAYLDPAPRYRVFMRQLDTPPYGGGTALANSFMLSRGPARPDESSETGPRGTFFHEMIHQWVGGVDAPHGVSSWFSEGLTTYYTHVLQLRGGYVSVDDFVKGLNRLSENYYSNRARTMSAEEITKVGFGDGDIRHIPYQRGALYFADLDSKIRAASGGARTLDVFMRELFERRETDPAFVFNHDAWVELVSREIGADARESFEAVILDGEVIFPPSDAFGACFSSRQIKYEIEGKVLGGLQWTRSDAHSDAECRR